MSTMHNQRGWVGLIVLLIALVIVAVLSQRLLKQMGLFPEDRVMTNTSGSRVPGPAGTVPVEPTGATPMVQGNPIERAKGVDSTLQQQSQDMGRRIDAQTK
jgi:hypothetical protein